MDFYEKVFALVAQIPAGKVTTYGAIARALGAGRSARIVGMALNSLAGKNSDLPCHRVVNRSGELTGKNYFESPTLMRELLEAECVGFIGDAVDLEFYFWEPFVSAVEKRFNK